MYPTILPSPRTLQRLPDFDRDPRAGGAVLSTLPGAGYRATSFRGLSASIASSTAAGPSVKKRHPHHISTTNARGAPSVRPQESRAVLSCRSPARIKAALSGAVERTDPSPRRRSIIVGRGRPPLADGAMSEPIDRLSRKNSSCRADTRRFKRAASATLMPPKLLPGL
jgi:hypothetical protein